MSHTVCAWCGKEMGESATERDSHGICKACEERYFPETPPQKPQVAESGQAFADDFERVHGHAGQGARNLY